MIHFIDARSLVLHIFHFHAFRLGILIPNLTLFIPAEAAKTSATPLAATEQTLSSSKTSKPSEMQGVLEQSNVQTDSHSIEQERQLQTHGTIPNVKQEVTTSGQISCLTGRY